MVAFSLLFICFSGVHAETAGETSNGVCQNGQEYEQGINGEMNAFGIGMQDDLNGWNSSDNTFGIGMQDDLNGWNSGDNTFGIGMQDDLNGWNPDDDTE